MTNADQQSPKPLDASAKKIADTNADFFWDDVCTVNTAKSYRIDFNRTDERLVQLVMVMGSYESSSLESRTRCTLNYSCAAHVSLKVLTCKLPPTRAALAWLKVHRRSSGRPPLMRATEAASPRARTVP